MKMKKIKNFPKKNIFLLKKNKKFKKKINIS